MANEPDVFKKLDALLNKHKNGDVPPAAEALDAIPILLDEIEEPEPFPVLTQIASDEAGEAMEALEVELELELEFIPDDPHENSPQTVFSAELPDVWEQHEHEFDAETTHGFGLSAFSREQAAQRDAAADISAVPGEDRATATGLELVSARDDPSEGGSAEVSGPPGPLAPESQQSAADFADTSAETRPEAEQNSEPADAAPAESELAGAPDAGDERAAELALNDTLTEKALRDLDRHVAAILERQVGPQLAHRLDQALASMLAQFSTNLESLVRDAVRDEMRRFFDGDNQ